MRERSDGGIPISIDTLYRRSNMRKTLATLSVVALILCGASLLTGCDKCGSGDDDSGSGGTTTAPEDK